MAKMTPSISLLLIAVACCWHMGATAEENIQNPSRTERQYSLNGDYAVPYYGPILELPSFSYNTETRAPNYFNRPFFASAPAASSGERTFQTLVNLISGRPLCAACPSCPACPSPTCPTCPVVPAACPGTTNAADPISITIDGLTACSKSSVGTTENYGTGGCTRVTAAPTGVFTVSFTNTGVAEQAAFIGIVATCPNTKITVKCGTFTAVITTQTKTITSGSTATATETGSAMIIVSRGGTTASSASCSWTASV